MKEVARDLFKQNPACLELTEFLRQAQSALEAGSFVRAKTLVDTSLEACRDIVSRPRRSGEQKIGPKDVFAAAVPSNPLQYALIAAIAFAALAAGYYFGGRFGGGWHQPLRQRGFLKKVGLRKR